MSDRLVLSPGTADACLADVAGTRLGVWIVVFVRGAAPSSFISIIPT
ncbi:hypothetical protein O4G98_17545 [Zoogloeaceae bacterium G21618-S1]|nr:hypothetical protein [Zoogloeaceae bacterium G21618-S1]